MTQQRRIRLDTLLVERGLAPSRERARALILAGRVRIEDGLLTKAGTLVPAAAELHLSVPDHPYVGRGGVKLAHALQEFGVVAEGRAALDLGASTGGFTDVLLRGGAVIVVALDVGHGQLDWTLRTDPRVVVIERFNARRLTPDDLPVDRRRFDVVTIDVAFISLRHILPVVPALLCPGADVIALVKPQFEAGRTEVGRGGIVRDAAVQTRVVDEICAAADALGLVTTAAIESPIAGADGNREFFVHLREMAVTDDPARPLADTPDDSLADAADRDR